MPAPSKSLSPRAVEAWSGATEIQKGHSYIRNMTALTAEPGPGGAVLRGVARGRELYQVQATISGGTVARASCSCPVGGGGHCKHAAALLSRYAQSSGDFVALRPLNETLGSLNTEQLQTLIGQMLLLAPHLRVLVDALAGRGQVGSATGKVSTIPALFTQIEADYGHRDDGYDQWNDWDDEGPDTTALETVLDEANAQRDTKPAAALAVYLQMISSVETAYETWADADEGAFDHLLMEAIGGVMALVSGDRLAEPGRTDAVEALLALENPYLLTQTSQLTDFAAQLQPSEYAALKHLLQQLHDHSRERHIREQVVRALLKLVPVNQQTPAQRESVVLSSGNLEEITEYFLGSEAPGARERLSSYLQSSFQPLEPIFGLIENHEAGDLLEEVIQARLLRRGSPGELSAESHWLFVRLAGSGRIEAAAALAERGLLSSADPRWEALLMSVSEDWARDWPRLLAAMTKQRALCDAVLKLLLTGAHELSEAMSFDLQYATHISSARRAQLAEALTQHSEVQSAETQHPETRLRAAEIRFELAERLVAVRGRANYQEAAEQLKMMAALIGPAQTAEKIRGLVRTNSHLAALKEELRRAGLL
jgi:uncharacterized Zn finger protein